MKINLIIGAGQLGSRHLQGLLQYTESQKIFVLDPSKQSLDLASIRASEIEHKHQIFYTSDWGILPQHLNLVIIATNAGIREVIIKKLLSEHVVDFLILEKVLFQKVSSYDEVRDLIHHKGVSTWVNHPRRMAKHYQEIKNIVKSANSKVFLHTYGNNWGLACNAIHLIDLLAYLTDSLVENIETDWLDNTILNSKREGHIEFTGTLKGTMGDSSQFIITSNKGESSILTSSISAGSHRWIISEGRGNQVIHIGEKNNFKGVIDEYIIEYQSSLTTRLAKQLFDVGNCDLPTYEEAYQTHVPYIKALLKKYIKLSGLTTDTCPIT